MISLTISIVTPPIVKHSNHSIVRFFFQLFSANQCDATKDIFPASIKFVPATIHIGIFISDEV